MKFILWEESKAMFEPNSNTLNRSIAIAGIVGLGVLIIVIITIYAINKRKDKNY
jgi:hypothetical protein